MSKSDRVIVIGAGPVGLCLSLALAQAGVTVTLIETLGDDNFLEQVPRAGTNHPATLEMFDRIGLYEKIEPRGIIAPVFHYWDRHERTLIAAFDHIHLKDDTRFPYVLQCERIKIVEEALKMAKAHPLIDLRLRDDVHRVRAGRRPRDRAASPIQAGEDEIIAGPLHRQRRRRAQHHPQGPRHRVRGLHLSGSHAQHRGRLRFPHHGYARAQLHLRSGRVVEPVPLEGPARPLARALSDRSRRTIRRRLQRPEALQARLQGFLPKAGDYDIVGSNLYTVHQRVAHQVPLGPRDPRRRLRACEQPDRRDGHEQRRS